MFVILTQLMLCSVQLGQNFQNQNQKQFLLFTASQFWTQTIKKIGT